MQWTGTDNFGDDAVRQINFKPGQAGYQKFGVDDAEAAAQVLQNIEGLKWKNQNLLIRNLISLSLIEMILSF